MTAKDLKLLLKEGEGLTIEFKQKYTTHIDRAMVAFANTKGGSIILGVDDKGSVTGEKLTNQMKAEILSLARNCDPRITLTKISQVKEVVSIEVPEGDEKPYSCSSGYFRRLDAVTQKMSQKEVGMVFKETADMTFEDSPRKDFSLADVSLKKIKAFLENTETAYRVHKGNLTPFLSSLSLYKKGKINNAGALMFASQIREFIPHAETILGAFKGKNKSHIYDRKDVRDDLLTQFNEAITFIKKHLNVRSEIRGVDRHDIYELPVDALREAVVNAVIHRDYSMRGTSIYVSVFDDRVEIVNPGGLPSGITRKNFGKESVRRNPIIADLFHRMGKVERMGSGIGRMRDLMAKAGLKEPVFKSDAFFRAVFYRSPEYALKPAVEKTVEKTVEKKILALIKANRKITQQELQAETKLSRRGIEWNLKKLKQKGLLRRIGPDKGGYWKVEQ